MKKELMKIRTFFSSLLGNVSLVFQLLKLWNCFSCCCRIILMPILIPCTLVNLKHLHKPHRGRYIFTLSKFCFWSSGGFFFSFRLNNLTSQFVSITDLSTCALLTGIKIYKRNREIKLLFFLGRDQTFIKDLQNFLK